MNRSRVSVIAVGVLAMFCTIAGTPSAQMRMDEKSSALLITEYFDKKTHESRAEDIQGVLDKRGRGEMTAPLLKPISAEETRTKALKLAAALAVPKLWESVRKYYETSQYTGDVIDVGLAGRESAAADYLFERWKVAELESPELTELQRGFCDHQVELKILEKFAKLMKEKDFAPERKQGAAAIIAAQMGSSAVDADSALDALASFKKKHGEHARPARLTNADLLAEGAFMTGKARVCGKCWWLTGPGRVGMAAIPEKWQTGGYLVTVHVKPLGDSGTFSVDIFSTTHEWSVDADIAANKWTMDNMSDPDVMAPALQRNAWNKVVLQIMHDGGSVDKEDRMMKVEVNGRLISDWCTLRGKINFVAVSSTSGEVVIGGIETNKK